MTASDTDRPVSPQDRRNVLLLAIAQAIFQSAGIIGIAFSGLAGYMLAENKIFATLPVAATVLGGAIATVPASHLMKKMGRCFGFILGSLAGVLSAIIGIAGIVTGSLGLFCLGHLFLGTYRAFAQYYRFAATDISPPSFHAKAISYVLAGAVVAAFLGPQLGIFSRELLAPYNFAGAYVAIGALSAISLIPIWLLDIPRPTAKQLSGPVRPLSEILRQPACAAAILSGTIGFSVMSMTMTATPIWMVACGFPVDTTTLVIQWHVLAMFVPAFFTGHLIACFGVLTIINTGIVLFTAAIVAAVTGITLINFTVALILLGIAWSFMFIGGSALLTRTYEPAEQAKVQGFNELMIFVGSIAASVSAGGLLTWFGWNTINFVVIPFLLITVAATIRAAKSPPAKA